MDIKNRTLFFGDNLKILEEKIPPYFFDLIYLDPPFSSNRNYNVLFKEGKVDSSAQLHAFLDTWEWTDNTIILFNDLKTNKNPQIAMLMNSLYDILKPTPMMAYLVNMTARLLLMHKALKPTGSLYLHCDPTASHYLKIMLDVIFGKENFRNEIIWCYKSRPVSRKYFGKKHDVILFYSKSENYYFDWKANLQPLSESTIKKYKYKDEIGKYRLQGRGIKGSPIASAKDVDPKWEIERPELVVRDYLKEGYPVEDYWYIDQLNQSAKERLGYPTQKPEELMARIIKASSKEGDWVLDPFCGCGTTVAVAEMFHRKWVGIDISMLAVNVIKKRMQGHYPGILINIDGIPMDFEGATKLADKDKIAFQDWAISIIGAHPPSGETKPGADRGIDGLILFYDNMDLTTSNPKLKKIVVQVKGGATSRGDIAKLKGDIEREDSPMGVLITLNEPTKEMIRETNLAGIYKYSNATSFPKIQILSIKDYFEGKSIKLPSDKIVNPFKKAEAKESLGQESIF